MTLPLTKNTVPNEYEIRHHVTSASEDLFFELGEALDKLIDGTTGCSDVTLVGEFHDELKNIIKNAEEVKATIDTFMGED